MAVWLLTLACSTQKNTAKSRWWHAFNAQYNTYYNGSVAYIEGFVEKEKGNQDNFTEIIPLYTVANKASKELGKANFDRAIEKCKKAIQLHSITKRPIRSSNKHKTAKDREWLNRKEYNPFLWKAWMLMGQSQFYSGSFDEAVSTFSYMSRLYQTQPAIYGKARAWLAKSFVEQGELYNAENVLRNMGRNTIIHWSAQKEWDYTYADYYIHTKEYLKAIPYLQKVIKHEMRRRQKAREWFLLGQLYEATGEQLQAYKAYKHVIRLNPPYTTEFNARIAMTEVMAGTQGKKMIGKLRRMAVNENNKDYLEQVYYAIGNIYLHQRDTLKAINAYEEGNKKSTRSGIEKGVLLLALGNLYWTKQKFSDAKRCYGEAIGLLDKDRKDYKQLAYRSEVLDELVPYTDAIHLQDSLQVLAKLPDDKRNEVIDSVIKNLKRQEKEKAKQLAEQQGDIQRQEVNDTPYNNDRPTSSQPAHRMLAIQNKGGWYFYNPMAVNQGKTAFQRLWGKRENVDNWQRINKTVVALGHEKEMTPQQIDSLQRTETFAEPLNSKTDSTKNEPHQRAFYLAQIPFTPNQVAASNQIIMNGLYHSGVIFKDKLNNLPLSEKALLRLVHQYPTYEKMDQAYYHLFLLYSRLHQSAVADSYVQRLKKQFPKSKWTTLLTDPYFKENAVLGVHIEDSLYAATYNAFKADRYDEVLTNVQLTNTRFPLGANRDKFLFIGALSKLNTGDAAHCIADLNNLVSLYQESPLCKMAGMIINGVQSGRKLHGGHFNLDDMWAHRSVLLNDIDSLSTHHFSNDRNTNFMFIIAYHPDSVQQNQLLYRVAKFNFTHFMVRNFDVVIGQDAVGLHLMKITGFLNFDEALQYARAFHQQKDITSLLNHAKTFVISTKNSNLLGTHFSYNDYEKYYNKYFAPLKIASTNLLNKPIDIKSQTENKQKNKQTNHSLHNDTYIKTGTQHAGEDTSTYILPDNMQQQQQQSKGGTIIYFGDNKGGNSKTETKETISKKPKKENTKQKQEAPKKVDLGDEYYDLEGF